MQKKHSLNKDSALLDGEFEDFIATALINVKRKLGYSFPKEIYARYEDSEYISIFYPRKKFWFIFSNIDEEKINAASPLMFYDTGQLLREKRTHRIYLHRF